jgi:sugar-specific transcriptional regulator TrmB
MNEIFERLKCSPTQARLYLLLLELGPSIASMLSKRAGIKRVTVYGALEGLVQKGLVEMFHKNNVSYYQACDPEVLSNLLDLQLEEEQQFNHRAHKKIKDLKKVQQKSEKDIIEVKGFIRYYQGRDAVRTLIQENLKLPHKTQYCIGLSGYHALHFAGEWKNYIQSRVKMGMKVYSIQADTEIGREYQSRDKNELRETRLISSQKVPDQGELNIIGDRIILYTSEENEEVGVKIINKKIAKILKKLFELAWEYTGEAEPHKTKKSM